jgi:hypothetical protein
MKLKFKKQLFQTDAVNAVADCFAGQPKAEGVTYRIDPGKGGSSTGTVQSQPGFDFSQSGFKKTASWCLPRIRSSKTSMPYSSGRTFHNPTFWSVTRFAS